MEIEHCLRSCLKRLRLLHVAIEASGSAIELFDRIEVSCMSQLSTLGVAFVTKVPIEALVLQCL